MIFAVNGNENDKSLFCYIIQYKYLYPPYNTRWDLNRSMSNLDNEGLYFGQYVSEYSIKSIKRFFESIYSSIISDITIEIDKTNDYQTFEKVCKDLFGSNIAFKRLIADNEDNFIISDLIKHVDFIRSKSNGFKNINIVSYQQKVDTTFGFSDWDYTLLRSGIDDESFIRDVEQMLEYFQQ